MSERECDYYIRFVEDYGQEVADTNFDGCEVCQVSCACLCECDYDSHWDDEENDEED